MNLKDIFNRNRARQLDAAPEGGEDGSELMAGNDAVRRKQTLWMAIAAAFVVLLAAGTS